MPSAYIQEKFILRKPAVEMSWEYWTDKTAVFRMEECDA